MSGAKPAGAGTGERTSCARLGWADALILLLLPVGAWFVFDICPWNQRGYADPWYYTGAGQTFESLVDSFGWRYYYIRFPVVFLNTLFCAGEDPVIGYVLLRFLILVMAGGSVYFMALGRFGRVVAVLSYAFVFCNPQLLRSILWDYPPFLSLPVALAGMALWLANGPRRQWRALLAGILFGVSVHSNLFIATAFACFALGLLMAHWWSGERWPSLFREVAFAAAGFVVLTTAGAIYLELRDGSFDATLLWTVNQEALRDGNTYARTHSTAFSAWGTTNTHVYVPFLLVIVAAVCEFRRSKRDRQGIAVVLGALMYCLFFLLYSALVGTFVLETFYYFTHLSVMAYLVLPTVLGWAGEHIRQPAGLMVAGTAGLAVPVGGVVLQKQGWISPWLPADLSWLYLSTVLGLTVAGLVAVRVLRARFARLIGLCGALLAVQVLTLRVPVLAQVYASEGEERERDCYAASVQFSRLWGKYSSAGGSSLCWYHRGDAEGDIYSLSFSVLGYALSEKWNDPEGMPAVGEYEQGRLREPGLRYIFAVATDPARIEEGKANLRDAGARLETLAVQLIKAGKLAFTVEVLAITMED